MAINKRDMGEALDRVAEAAAKLGLPLYATHFELVDGHTLSQLAAYGGMPSRYRHWSFGKLYGHYQAAYHFRRSRIYELVVNHEPAYAFVDRSLDLGSCLVVAAHVLAHVAYFRSHAAFEATSRDEVGVMAEHRRILERYSRRFGRRQVEKFIDAGLVLADFTAESPRMRNIGESQDDVLGFLATSAPHLHPWQLHVLRVLGQIMIGVTEHGTMDLFVALANLARDFSPGVDVKVKKMIQDQIHAMSKPILLIRMLNHAIQDGVFSL